MVSTSWLSWLSMNATMLTSVTTTLMAPLLCLTVLAMVLAALFGVREIKEWCANRYAKLTSA